MRILVSYVATLVVMLALDAGWLTFAALPMYRSALGQQLLTFRATPGIIFYLLYTAGVMVFVLPRAQAGGVPTALMNGALFGLFCYATYDLTNYATLKPWTLSLAATDMVWGMVLTAVSATAGMLAGKLVH